MAGTMAAVKAWRHWMNRLLEEEEPGKAEANMAVFKRGKKWWYNFVWNGELIRESTNQSNKRTAEQMEAAHKASLAKGEVGIRDRQPAPTTADFAKDDFMPH